MYPYMPQVDKEFMESVIRASNRCITPGADQTSTVTKQQTDGQTSCDGIVRAMHTRRVIKTESARLAMQDQISGVENT